MASGDLGAFAPQEELAKRQFQEFEGDLSSRFSGAGMGARKSSGFHNLATQGAQDFALQLSAQRQQLQRQALMDLFGLSESLLGQKPYEQFLVPKKKSFWEELLGGLSSGIGSAAGTFTGLYGGKKAGLFKE